MLRRADRNGLERQTDNSSASRSGPEEASKRIDRKKFWGIYSGGRAGRFWRTGLVFVSGVAEVALTLFDIGNTLKRCVGGFVCRRSTHGRLHIALLGFRSDDGVSASLFVGFHVSSETEAQSNRRRFVCCRFGLGCLHLSSGAGVHGLMCKVRRQETEI